MEFISLSSSAEKRRAKLRLYWKRSEEDTTFTSYGVTVSTTRESFRIRQSSSKQLGIDILHTHEPLSDVVGFLASRRRRVLSVSTLHGWINNSLKDRLKTSLDLKILRFFNRVLVVSRVMREQAIRSGIPPHKIELVHNGIVVEKYDKGVPAGYINSLVNKNLKKPIIGTIGRLSAEKGHRDFVKAASMVLAKGYDPTFVMVGDGPERENLRKLIESLNVQSNVFLAGYATDMPRVFRDLHLMVLPSYTEGLPNVALEALLMEVPVVATRVGGTPEVIRNDETGVLVDPGSPEQMADKIIEYLTNPERFNGMARAGSTLVRKEFSFVHRTQKMERIYDELLRKRSQPREHDANRPL